MSVLSLYLMRTILMSTLLVVLVLLALAGLFEFIGQLDATEGQYGIFQALLFSLLRLPQLAFEILPIAALIGALLGLGSLSNNSELVVMRTAGLSVMTLAGMVALSGMAIMVVTALIGEFIAPPLDYFARNMRNEARYEQQGRDVGNAAWVKDGPVILHLEKINTEFEFGALYLFRFNEDNSLASIARAENAGIDDTENWILEDVKETRFDNDSVQVIESSVAVESFGMNAEMLGITLVKPVSLSARGLMSYISYLKKNSLNAERYETEFWARMARTVTIIVMPVLALAFVFGSLRSTGSGSRLMVGILIGLAYFLASEMTANSGQVFNLNPALVTWLPSMALLGLTAFALNRVR
ncbi:MAG: LPS export ABC transporter permease LptG [Woeseia sp.]|nr:LPS export ABC transporter permease LptG [Woeseia sp.]|tara:strand:- start:1321 stop:2385 length:1065 start_codon:yes stop_codon:yes gene_type:complete